MFSCIRMSSLTNSSLVASMLSLLFVLRLFYDCVQFSDIWSLARTGKLSKKMVKRFERTEQQW